MVREALRDAQASTRQDFRFSRREVRERDAAGATRSCSVHLERLVELEYLLVHRGGRGQSFVYELLYDGQGQDGTPFLPGLIDVEALSRRSTTATWRGRKATWRGGGGAKSGAKSGGVGGSEVTVTSAQHSRARTHFSRARAPKSASREALAESRRYPRCLDADAWPAPSRRLSPSRDPGSDPEGIGRPHRRLPRMDAGPGTSPSARSRPRVQMLAGFRSWCEERGLTRSAEVTKPILERYQR